LSGLKSSEFYGPGSIVRAEVARFRGLSWNVPKEISVYFDRSLAFGPSVPNVKSFETLATYSATNTLESGGLHGADRIQGKAAAIRVVVGEGHVILFGFSPQHRGQTHGTFRLLFNAILFGRDVPEEGLR